MDWLAVLPYVGSAMTMCASAFAKTFQTRNIVGGHYIGAYLMSWLITTMDVVNIIIIVHVSWWAVLSAGFGGSIGVVGAMYFHTRIYKKGLHNGSSATSNKQRHHGSLGLRIRAAVAGFRTGRSTPP